MQPRKNYLPLILIALGVVIVIAIGSAIMFGAGLIAFLVPAQAVSSPISTVEVPGPVIVSTIPVPDPPKIPVKSVQVEIGVGSPIPVEVVASGEWSSTCDQLVQTSISYLNTRQIDIQLFSAPEATSCTAGAEGLPFSFRLPLNMVEMPSGNYTVSVNGTQAQFDWKGAPSNPDGYFPEFIHDVDSGMLPTSLLDAHVEVGVGSPTPLDVMVAGEWPTLCSQLAEVRTSVEGQQIGIEILATPSNSSCPPDYVGLTFGLRIPLNTSGLQPGNYNLMVNGLQTSFTWPAPAGQPESILAPYRMAYLSSDGNVWMQDLPDGQPRQVTNDGSDPRTFDLPNVSYDQPLISSDGTLLAYRRGASELYGSGIITDYGLWVTNLATGENIEVYDQSPVGYSWKPNSHLLAYASELDEAYFPMRGTQPDAAYATSIMGYDADTGITTELVKPERGFAIVRPAWSPDGRFISFDEVVYYEGRGPFAYYDFNTNNYIHWNEALGIYSWSLDGESLAYDNMTYTATGDESIFIRSRQTGEISEFSMNYNPGYAMMPVFSPQGDRIAYLVSFNDPDAQQFSLYTQPYPQGEAVALGEFDNVYLLNWSPDGTRLILSSGPYPEQSITEVNLLTGESSVKAKGMQPSISLIP